MKSNSPLLLSFSLFICLISFFQANSQITLWTEDFTGETNGAVVGTAAGTPGGTWSVTTAPSGTFSKQNTFLFQNCLQVDNTITEGVWATNIIDISSTGMATISVDLNTAATNSTDYVRAYYKVDGGPEVLFAQLLGQLVQITTTGSAIISGNSIQVVIRGMDNTTGTLLGLPFSLYADNISVTTVPVVYSRKSGNWSDNNATTGTWSSTGFTGASCNCVPNNNQVAAIGNGFTVDIDASSSVGGLDVQNTGVLRYNTSNQTITINKGLARVRNGGSITSSSGAITGEQLIFNANVGAANFQVDAGGSAAIEDFVLGSSATNTHFISGGGSISISDDILIGASGATITNNLTTTLAITDRIEFSAGFAGSTLLNNGTITAASLVFDDDNNFFTNASSATFSGDVAANGVNDDNNTITNNTGATLSFVNLSGDASNTTTGGDITILNSGTINQSGTFNRIAANANALNDINNLSGATWNYSGTGHDTDIRLLANNPTNTFTYSLSGAQQIITPVTGNGYSNLTLTSASAAAKTALGNFAVSGNYTRSGSATFSNGGFTVTFNGTATQTISAVGGESFAGLTINNSFGTSPQVTTNNNISVSGTLTMTAGNVNLNNNSFNLSGTTLSYSSGWMYGGSITRAIPTTAITVGTVGGHFPIGIATQYRPFFLGKTNLVNSGGNVTVSHTGASASSSVVSIADASAGNTIIIRSDDFWTVSTTGISAGVFRIQYGGTGLGIVSSVAHLHSCLVNSVVATHIAGSGTTTNPRVERSALTFTNLNNSFYVGSDNASSPLPIELTAFNAALSLNGVLLSWSTASELNNDFFTIERSTDGEVFEEVSVVKGKGTSHLANSYTSLDEVPLSGISYYRLKQTDFDKKFTYSKLQIIDNPNGVAQLKLYPNPVVNNQLNVEIISMPPNQEVALNILTLQGFMIHQSTYVANMNGSLKKLITTNSLPPGVYIVVISSSKNSWRKKIIIP